MSIRIWIQIPLPKEKSRILIPRFCYAAYAQTRTVIFLWKTCYSRHRNALQIYAGNLQPTFHPQFYVCGIKNSHLKACTRWGRRPATGPATAAATAFSSKNLFLKTKIKIICYPVPCIICCMHAVKKEETRNNPTPLRHFDDEGNHAYMTVAYTSSCTPARDCPEKRDAMGIRYLSTGTVPAWPTMHVLVG